MKSGKFLPLDARPRIAEGTYKGRLVSWNQFFSFGQKIFINSEVIDSNGQIVNLSFIANIKVTEEGQMIAPKRSTKLSKTLSALLPTTPLNDMDLEALMGLTCLCKVEDSKRDSYKKIKPEKDWYSTITELSLLPQATHEFIGDE